MADNQKESTKQTKIDCNQEKKSTTNKSAPIAIEKKVRTCDTLIDAPDFKPPETFD